MTPRPPSAADPRRENETLRQENETLRRRLAEAEQVNEALTKGQIDAVVDAAHQVPLLLRQAQDALRASEEKFRTIVMTADEGIWTLDADRLITFVNERIASMLGTTVEDMIGHSLLDFVDASAREEELQGFERRRQGVREHRDVPLLRKDGTVLWASVSFSPLKDPDGLFAGSLGMVTDITERKLAERALRESEEKFAAAFRASPNLMSITRIADGTILEVNEAYSRLLGYTRPESVGKTTAELSIWANPADRAAFVAGLEKSGEIIDFETTLRRKDGSLLTVVDGARAIRLQGETCVLSVVHDITERKRTEEQLREASEYVRSLIEASLDPLVTISPGGKITDVNAATEAVTGRGRADLIGSDFSDYFTEPENAREGYLKVLAERAVRDYPLTIRHVSGRTTDVLYNGSIYRDEVGRVQGVFASARDVSERKRAERVREATYRISEAAQSAGSLKEFFQQVHEIVSPLISARNFYVALLDPETGMLSFPYFVDEVDPPPTPRPPGRGLTEYVIRTGEPLLAFPEVFDDLVARGEVELVGSTSVDWLGVPLKAPGRTIGAVVVQTYAGGVRFSDSDRDLLTFISGQLAMAVQRKQAEEALSESEAFLNALLSAIPIPVFYKDRDGRYLGFNRAYETFFGATRKGLIGKTVFDISPRELAEAYRARDIELFESGGIQQYESQVKAAHGVLRDVIFNKAVFTDSRGIISGLIGAILDITERRRAEEALRESESELKEAQRVAHVGSWSWVIETDTVKWSEELFRIAGRDPAGTPPNYLRDHATLYNPESLARLQALVERAIRTGEPYEADLELIRPDGTTRWIADTGEARRDAKGQIVGLHGTVEDITEHRRLQAQLLQAQKMEAVGRLAGGIAHDFNNLLTVIGGYSEMLAKTIPEDEPSHRHVTEIGLAARRAVALTRQLLAFSRKQVLDPKVLDLNLIANGMLELLSRLLGEDVEIVLELQKGLSLVKVDPGQIEQVIMNLAVNARDAMPQGGKLILETQDVELDESYVRGHPSVTPGPYVLLAASDTGCGMTPGTLSHIFEPFFTTKALGKGTGLGLSTVFGIVKQSGGEISVTSVPGEGTTFKIYLPRVIAETGERKPASSPEIIPLRTGETVLVVEDDEAVGRLARWMLSDLGYEVLSATRGEEALEIAGHHPRPIHLLLTDIVMPGMRGPEVATRLLALRPETRVVFMSGYAEELVLDQAAVRGSAVFLQKPFTFSMLGEKLREALDAGLPGEQQGAGVHGGREPLSILHMDDDRDILEITRFFLTEDGHRVVSCVDVEETVARYAEALTRGERFDLVLLDLSIPGKKGGVEGMREILKLDPTAKIVACSGAGPSEVGPLESGFVGIVEKPFTTESLKPIRQLL